MSTLNNNVNILIGGDIAIQHPLNNSFIDNEVESFIKAHDFRIANWEAPIIINTDFKKINKAGPHIFQNDTYSLFLKKNLFNVYSLANNHIMDYGSEGLQKTLDELSQTHCTGAANTYKDVYEPLVLTKGHFKIAILACGESQFGCVTSKEQKTGYAWVNSNEVCKHIVNLKSTVDFIIILPHAGLEMENLPLPEWRSCYQNFIDLGADLVIASHPHVVQPKEKYKGKYIYYSLGNFLFNSNHPDERWNTSLMLSLNFSKKSKKTIEVEEHFIQYKNDTLSFNDDYSSIFEDLNNILKGDNAFYLEKINEICLRCWKDYYEDYYFYERDMLNQVQNRIIKNKYIKKIVKRVLQPKNRKNQILLYHNISIETHRYTVERVLKLLNNII